MAARRPPKTSDLIRWFVDAGLKPRVSVEIDGSVVVESMPDAEPLPSGLPASEIAARIKKAGETSNGNRIS